MSGLGRLSRADARELIDAIRDVGATFTGPFPYADVSIRHAMDDGKAHLVLSLESTGDLAQDFEWLQAFAEYLRLAVLKALPYQEYLRTDHWHQSRQRAIEAADRRCQLCNTSGCPLQVHHRTYERLGEEKQADLIALCDGCHAKHHDKVVR